MPETYQGPVMAVFDHALGAYVPAAGLCPGRVPGGKPGRICAQQAIHEVAGILVCEGHFRKIHTWHNEQIGREAVLEREAKARFEMDWDREMGSWAATGRQVIYYVLRADGLIKIGTTTNLANRLTALRSEHGKLDVLLTHCGDHKRERMMHAKFRELRVTGEWFRPHSLFFEFMIGVRRKRANSSTRLPGTVPVAALVQVAATLARVGLDDLAVAADPAA